MSGGGRKSLYHYTWKPPLPMAEASFRRIIHPATKQNQLSHGSIHERSRHNSNDGEGAEADALLLTVDALKEGRRCLQDQLETTCCSANLKPLPGPLPWSRDLVEKVPVSHANTRRLLSISYSEARLI